MSEATPTRRIPPDLLAKIGRLELIAKTVVEGAINGIHRSARYGFSQEFAEHRDYVLGDDIRFIDWNAFARTDRPQIKLFEGETNTQLVVVLDTSASMAGDARDSVRKFDYAVFLAASLIHLARRQQDAVGLLTYADDVSAYFKPSSRPQRIQSLYHQLETTEPAGETRWMSASKYLSERLHRRALIAVISDFFDDVDELKAAFAPFARHDLVVFHTRSENDRSPELGRHPVVRDVESGAVVEVDVEDFRQHFDERFTAHADALRQATLDIGGDYVDVDTNEPLDRLIVRYLRYRARRR